jgi:opine dehydrogenase
MHIAVLGAGSGGTAVAADLHLRGHDVCLWNRSEQRITAVETGIHVTGERTGFARVRCTTDLGVAVAAVELIVIATTADAHQELAAALRDLAPQTPVLLLPGRTGGALEFTTRFPGVTVVEAQSLVFACRTSGATVEILGVKAQVPVACLPGTAMPSVALDAFPTLTPVESVLHTGFGNIAAVLHPGLLLRRLQRTHAEPFYGHLTDDEQGTLLALDQERVSVARAYGVETPPLTSWIGQAYPEASGVTLLELLQSVPAYGRIPSPATRQTRYLTEDVPTGLVPLAAFGQAAGLSMPVTNQTIDAAQRLTGQDWRACGRHLAAMGLAGLSPEAIVARTWPGREA